MLVLALVFTMGGLPASALVCGDLSENLRAAAPAGGSCHATEPSKPCCCGHEAAKGSDADFPAHWSQSGCGCAIEAPAPMPPADRAVSRVLFLADVSSLPQPAVFTPLSSGETWVAIDRVLLLPGTTHPRATPPRAPPLG